MRQMYEDSISPNRTPTERSPLGKGHFPANSVHPPPTSFTRAAVGLAVSLLLIFAVAVARPSTGKSVPPLSAVNQRIPSCTLTDCYGFQCDWSLAPFVCLQWNGGIHGGCSPSPWVQGTCDEQCDSSDCGSDAVTGGDVEGGGCDVRCPPELCLNEMRLCGGGAKYQCLVGSAAYGCSGDLFDWSVKTPETTCSKCCNANLCD